MQLVERHKIKPNHHFWQQIDELCFLSKNLYNYANYIVRQSFIFDQIYLGYNQLYHLVKGTPDYQALPAKVSQQVLRLLDKNWKSFFQARKSYKLTPDKFTGLPKLPNYKHKIKGRNLLTYSIQAISKAWLKLGIVKLSGTDIKLKTKVDNICQARIIPKVGQYIIEIVYEKSENPTVNNPKAVAAIDIGINNLAALTSNQKGFIPILINGRPLKSINQLYNKTKAKRRAETPMSSSSTTLPASQAASLLKGVQRTSKQIQQLTRKRNNRVDSYLHLVSRWIINHLDKQGIGKLIIGNNQGWKQSCNLGKSINQSFTAIPHHRLIEMLIYKGKMLGIEVIVREESYTSRASFLSLDPIPSYGESPRGDFKFSGYRESRGMYKQKGCKTRINADVQASYNLLRKEIPGIFTRRGIEGCVVRPVRIKDLSAYTPSRN